MGMVQVICKECRNGSGDGLDKRGDRIYAVRRHIFWDHGKRNIIRDTLLDSRRDHYGRGG